MLVHMMEMCIVLEAETHTNLTKGKGQEKAGLKLNNKF